MINKQEAVLNKNEYREFTERCLGAVASGHEVPHAVEYLESGDFKVTLLVEQDLDLLDKITGD
tara:strand:+ start:239 stop:427 length:189 start_codon:yes stop_codon:yes gene_type:complete